MCYWSCSHKACIPACVALACVRQCVKSWLPLQIFIFYPTITLCCGIMLYYAVVLHSQKHFFLHVLRMNVCNKNAILCSITSLTFCGFRVIFARFNALLTEPTHHYWRLCSWQRPSRQNNTLCCSTLYVYSFSFVLLFCTLFSCVPAGNLEQSERGILTLRSQQGRFDERIAMMQHLLEVSSTFPWI